MKFANVLVLLFATTCNTAVAAAANDIDAAIIEADPVIANAFVGPSSLAEGDTSLLSVKLSDVADNNGLDTGLKTFVISSKKSPVLRSGISNAYKLAHIKQSKEGADTGHPLVNGIKYVDYSWNYGGKSDGIEFAFKAGIPSSGEVCATTQGTSCDLTLTIDYKTEFNHAYLRFANTCFDDVLIDWADLRQWTWVECGFWDWCGFDGGYWKEGKHIEWGAIGNGYSWCIGDDPNAWKKYSVCQHGGYLIQCQTECGEGHWVPSKQCRKEYVFSNDGNAYPGSDYDYDYDYDYYYYP